MYDRSAVTIHDVATLAGLPIRTVSAVLYDQCSDVPADHRQRIQTAAAKLAYTAFPPERHRPGGAVAIVVPTATAWFYAEAAEAAQEILADHGIDSAVISLPRGPAHHESPAGLEAFAALAGRVSGLLLMGTELSSLHTGASLDPDLAVVGIGPQTVPGDCVRIDDELAAWSATSHLLDFGHWNVALLAGTDATMAKRRAGFTRALAENDLEADPDLIVSTDTSIDGGFMAMNELIANRGRPTAVLAGCDEIAFGALRALREHGLSAPTDVSLIGIDDHPMSAFLELTTISQPVAEQAAFAASLLADRLQNGSTARSATTYWLPTSLVTRKTTRRARATSWANSEAAWTGQPRPST